MNTETLSIERVKLTKAALSKFLVWSSSKYNDYCGYGTKKENVDIVFAALKAGCYVNYRGVPDESKKVFTVMCAGGVGENGAGRSWRTKQSGGEYEIDCENLTIIEKWSKREISFINNQTKQS
jgi:hypothetical protein